MVVKHMIGLWSDCDRTVDRTVIWLWSDCQICSRVLFDSGKGKQLSFDVLKCALRRTSHVQIIGNWFLKSSVECVIQYEFSFFWFPHFVVSKIHIMLSHVDPRLVENVEHICRGCGGQFSVFQIFPPRDACLRLRWISKRNLLVHELHATVRLQSDHSPIYSQITVRSQSDHIFYQQLEIFRGKKGSPSKSVNSFQARNVKW